MGWGSKHGPGDLEGVGRRVRTPTQQSEGWDRGQGAGSIFGTCPEPPGCIPSGLRAVLFPNSSRSPLLPAGSFLRIFE